ncbi:hypothetical protein HDU96_010842 [Phlyctochytrium bullatum]|nr:hypothetical protein HDU96_010842 [Phlyctochytrium bullatum]
MRPSSSSSAPAKAVVPKGPPRPPLNDLSSKVLPMVLLHLHPNDLIHLAAANHHLRQTVPGCIDFALALHQLKANYNHVRGDLLFEHNVAAVAWYPEIWLAEGERWVSGRFEVHDANDSRMEELRLRRVAAVKALLQRGLWTHAYHHPCKEGCFCNWLKHLVLGVANLRSIELLKDLRQAFPGKVSDDLNDKVYRSFIFICAGFGYTDGVALVPPNHPILSEPESARLDRTLLEMAVMSEIFACVKLLVELGAPVTKGSLHCAIDKSDGDFNMQILEYLLEHGAETEGRYMGRTALQRMALAGHAKPLEILLAHGADHEARSEGGATALHLAACAGRVQCIQLLLIAGADIHAVAWNGLTPLGVAEACGFPQAAKLLKRRGASRRLGIPMEFPPLYIAVDRNNCKRVTKLVEAGADLRKPPDLSKPPLHHAVHKGNAGAALVLLDAGADPNERCWSDRTALHWWAAGMKWGSKAEEVLKALVKCGVKVNARDSSGMTALHVAAQESKAELLVPLLKVGVDADALNGSGETWLEVACSVGLGDWILQYAGELEKVVVSFLHFDHRPPVTVTASTSTMCYCHDCDREFVSTAALRQHWNTSAYHNPITHTCHCGRGFHNAHSYNAHLTSSHNHCHTCDRSFATPRALMSHVASNAHAAKDKKCPFCATYFKTISAIAAHLESGNCPNLRTNPRQVAQFVRSWEARTGSRNVFTTPMIEYHNTSHYGSREDLSGCYNRWSGLYECPLCDRDLSSENSLRAHLNSSAHACKEYRCITCSREFVSLAALLLHFEWSGCGQARHESIRKLANGLKMLTY